ncbi:hypothetical protein Terro_2995 [Terriglobus roseus DSM 18391]|uniref:Uncharacterized protein n=1 Tax=Terriglobus roseus (strain DSM 18391 / NRRL B-41598 / KBS 63) TaxID=926566 RepID=I3ZJ09_TERRK|nr:hypothetical protein [Terriglobus roseus]AFL89227.1 hypothetical protein Terro_2995 [Terriglobus roseus DSM 18391]
MRSAWFGEQRENVGATLALVSLVLASIQLSVLLLILGLSFSSYIVSAYLSAIYFLGEIVCAVVAVPLAVVSLRFEAGGDTGRRALFMAIGVTGVCAFFMAFPS